MKNKVIVCFFMLFYIVGFAQKVEVVSENVSVRYIKAKEVSNKFNMVSPSKIKSKNLQKVLIKCKIKSLNDEVIDLNKLSLVDHKNKLRYRPTDITTQTVGQVNILRLLKKDLKIGGFYKFEAGLSYLPEIVDTFNDYDMPGYVNVEIPYSFGTRKKRKQSIVYFHPVKFNFKAKLFFAISTQHSNPNFELFYGSKKISPVEF